MNEQSERRPFDSSIIDVEVKNTAVNIEADFEFFSVNGRQALYDWRQSRGVAPDQPLDATIGDGEALTRILSPNEATVTIAKSDQIVQLDASGLWLLDGDQRQPLKPSDQNLWTAQSIADLLSRLTQPSASDANPTELS